MFYFIFVSIYGLPLNGEPAVLGVASCSLGGYSSLGATIGCKLCMITSVQSLLNPCVCFVIVFPPSGLILLPS